MTRLRITLRGTPLPPPPDPTFDDGMSGAKSAVIQHPTLLDLSSSTNEAGIDMALRPAWNVAGVDYPVGPATSQIYKSVVTDALPAGCTKDATYQFIRVGGSGAVVIDGYDFATVPYLLHVQGDFTGTLTVQNCKFKTGAPYYSGSIYFANPGNSGLFTLQYSILDGDEQDVGGFLCNTPLGGALIEYNWFKNAQSDCLDITHEGTPTCVVRYNVFENINFSTYAHGDFVQVWNGIGASGGTATLDIYGIEVYGNLFFQPLADPVTHFPGAVNSCLRVGDLGSRTCFGPTFHHNTVIGLGNSGHNQDGSSAGPALGTMTQYATTNTPYGVIDSPVSRDNYFWTAGGGSFNGPGKNGFGNWANYPISGPNQNITGAVDYSNNINMRDGSAAPVYP